MSHGARLGLGCQGPRRGWKATINRTPRDTRNLLKDSPRDRCCGANLTYTGIMRQCRHSVAACRRLAVLAELSGMSVTA